MVSCRFPPSRSRIRLAVARVAMISLCAAIWSEWACETKERNCDRCASSHQPICGRLMPLLKCTSQGMLASHKGRKGREVKGGPARIREPKPARASGPGCRKQSSAAGREIFFPEQPPGRHEERGERHGQHHAEDAAERLPPEKHGDDDRHRMQARLPAHDARG